MSSEPGVDHPAVDGEALVWLTERGIPVSSRVQAVDGLVLWMRPPVGGVVGTEVVQPGDPVEVVWQRPGEHRSVPAEVLEVEQGTAERWRLRMTGRPRVVQRRHAVRARVVVPVAVRLAGPVQLPGATVDLSETGARISLAAPGGGRPQPGALLHLRLELDDGVLDHGLVDTPAELTRLKVRDHRWTLTTRFVDLPERDQDRIRRRVFQALREERARLAAG